MGLEQAAAWSGEVPVVGGRQAQAPLSGTPWGAIPPSSSSLWLKAPSSRSCGWVWVETHVDLSDGDLDPEAEVGRCLGNKGQALGSSEFTLQVLTVLAPREGLAGPCVLGGKTPLQALRPQAAAVGLADGVELY